MTQCMKTFTIEYDNEIEAVDKEDCKRILLSQLIEDMNEGILIKCFQIKEKYDD
jgi:hypothetical protein